MEGELVSVVIPCFNQAHFLGNAIESVLAQTYPYVELVVVDDGSEDNTSEICGRYPGIRCIRQDNRGLSAARNTGLRCVTGSLVAFLDSDDRLLPGALAAGVSCLRMNPECVFVAGAYRFIAADGSGLVEYPPHGVREHHYVELLRTNYIGMPGVVLYRRDLFSAIGGFDVSLKSCEDYDLYFRATRNFPIQCYDEVVGEYRRHGANMSGNPSRMLTTACRVLQEQRTYTCRNTDATQALRMGIERVQKLYGDQLVEHIQTDAASGEWKKVATGLKVLADCYPDGLARCESELAQAGHLISAMTTEVQHDLVYDVGMNNGDDTAYYLDQGFRVVAVEADPDLCAKASLRFADELKHEQLTIVNMGVGPQRGVTDFWICETNSHWNSFNKGISSRDESPHHSIQIPCQTFEWILWRYGIPCFLKIDIEGHEYLCVEALRKHTDLPQYLSVELGDLEYFLEKLTALGYSEFKCISQFHFLPLQLPPSPEQLRLEAGDASRVRRFRNWVFPEGASGPFGENTPGQWLEAQEMRRVYAHYQELHKQHATSPFWNNNSYSFWLDLHARRKPEQQQPSCAGASLRSQARYLRSAVTAVGNSDGTAWPATS
jgi:FkbM family methyltransferase